MAIQFTPAAERALLAASAWRSPDDGGWLAPPEVLLGLLAEAECRAAVMLAGAGIDRSAVEAHWADFREIGEDPSRARNFSPALSAALAAAQERLVDYPRPLVLATEHLLLGLAASGDDVSKWLMSRGVAVDRLEAEIHRLYGQVPGPVAVVEWNEERAESLRPSSGRGRKAESRLAGAGSNVRGAAVPKQAEAAGKLVQPTVVLRILDASANRAREGLRVVEDFLRFGWDDRHLTELIKQLRHELADVLRPFYAAGLVASRDTLGDVGTSITTPAEQSRLSCGDVVQPISNASKKRFAAWKSTARFSTRGGCPARAIALSRLYARAGGRDRPRSRERLRPLGCTC